MCCIRWLILGSDSDPHVRATLPMTSDQQLQLTVVAVGTAVEITNLSQCPFYFFSRRRWARGGGRNFCGGAAGGCGFFFLYQPRSFFFGGGEKNTPRAF